MLSMGSIGVPLLEWASGRGVFVSERVELRSGANGRGLFATGDIAAGDELVTLPLHAQLGMPQLAEGEDAEMQKMAAALPWKSIIGAGATFLPCAVALCAERRKGAASGFGPYLAGVPEAYANAIAPCDEAGGDDAPWGAPPAALAPFPLTAGKVAALRAVVRAVHESCAPPSLPLHELCWACAVVCSRSLVRRCVRPLDEEAKRRVGEFAASDRSRLLPIIDLVNHGGGDGSNVDVRHLEPFPADGRAPTAERPYDEYATSLVATRDVRAGDELLLDYGGGAATSAERLLNDFGFVLRDAAGETLSLPLDELVCAVGSMSDARAGMGAVPPEDERELRRLCAAITKFGASSAPGGGAVGPPLGSGHLLFGGPNLAPSLPTLAIALALSPRGAADVRRLLAPYAELRAALSTGGAADPDLMREAVKKTLLRVVQGCDKSQVNFAQAALRGAVARTLEAVAAAPAGRPAAAAGSFDDAAREFGEVQRALMERVLVGP